ncbi:ROK family protein [candidate division KSB1 bacterium]|nr:ROK family protein [candidate division KSB1 bacterium]
MELTSLKDAFIGLDLGGTFLKYALGTADGTIFYKNKIPSNAKKGGAAIFSAMFAAVADLLKQAESSNLKVKAIGCGSPGAVDFDRGKIIGNTPNLRDWADADIRGRLSSRFHLPVWADNDANLMALAECRYGAAKGYRYVIALTLGTGIGGGIFIGDELYRGARFAGSEIGHMSIKYDGIPCNCGGIGCIEAYASAPAMVKSYIEKLSRSDLPIPKTVNTELVFAQAQQGQMEAISVIDETCHYLGAAIGNVVNIFNPEIIVIGGGVADAGDQFIAQIWQQTQKYAMAAALRGVKLVRAQLGNNAGMIGAIALAADYYKLSAAKQQE